MIEEVRFAADSLLEGDGFEPSVSRQKDNAFRDSSFPNMRARHRRLRKRSPPRPAAASSSCRSRSDERRTHSPTRRWSVPPPPPPVFWEPGDPALAPPALAIRPGSTLIEEVRFATVSPPEGDDSNPRSPIYGELAARGPGATRPTALMIGFVTRGERQIAEEGGIP